MKHVFTYSLNVLCYWNQNVFRFANIFHFKGVSVDKIENVVKTVKGRTTLDLSCESDKTMLIDQVIMSL